MPYAGFSGPIPSVNLLMIAYPGSAPFRAGKRTAQRYTYSSYFPPLQYDATQGLFFGGNFWDSRATGYLTRTPDGEQSQFPPVDPNEMASPDTACIAYKLSLAPYAPLFEQIWGAGSLSSIKWPSNVASVCATPEGAAEFGSNTQLLALSPSDRTLATNDYDHWAQSMSAFEHSLSISPFTSKFDAFPQGHIHYELRRGRWLCAVNGKGNCNSCHLDGRGTALQSTQADTSTAADVTPVFTCFGSANEGLHLGGRAGTIGPRRIPELRFTTRLLLIRWDLRPTREALPTQISVWEPFSEAVLVPLPTPTRVGHSMPQPSTAKCKWPRRGMWLWCRPSARVLKRQGPTSRRSSSTMATSRA